MEGLEELEEYLRVARILDVGAFPDPGIPQPGAHRSFRLILEGGVAVLAKPEHTIDDGERVVRHEVAGWVTARELGWTDLVAATVLRRTDVFPDHDDDEVATSVQVLWPGFELDAQITQFEDDDVWRAAVFDVLVFHCDRTHNWGAVPGHGRKRLKLIDHGYAFGRTGGGAFSSSFATAKNGQDVPDELLEQLGDFLERAEHGQLAELLEADLFQELLDRGRKLVQQGAVYLP